MAQVVVLLVTFYLIVSVNRKRNEKEFGVSVHTAFSGWTHANNALYAMPRIHLDPKYIKDPEIRKMHTFFSNYMDTTSFVAHQVGSGFLWEAASPMEVLRKKLADSLLIGYQPSFYKLAGAYERYGLYLQRNYPYEYFMGFMVPNIGTLLTPHTGEMAEYHVTRPDFDLSVLQRYYLKQEDLQPRYQIYATHINQYNKAWYHLRGALVCVCLPVFIRIRRRKKITAETVRLLTVCIAFTACFYVLMLYSSWFMYRYLIPVLHLITVFIFLTIYYSAQHRRST